MILTLVAALALTSPTPMKLEECTGQIVCLFTIDGRVCVCAGPVLNLGSWDPRPGPEDWPSNAYVSSPPEFGAYPTEKP